MPFNIPTTNPWSCLPASFAMATGIPFGAIINAIGHDGSALIYQDKNFHAGFHTQECIEVVQKWGWTCTPIELCPKITPDGKEEREILFGNEDGNWARFLHHLTICQNGVIEGVKRGKKGHAVAWDGQHIYDPSGKIYSFSEHLDYNFYPRILWKLIKVSNEI